MRPDVVSTSNFGHPKHHQAAPERFHDATHASLGARAIAGELAHMFSRLLAPEDTRGDVRRVRAFGQAAHVVVQRAYLWSAEDVRVWVGVCGFPRRASRGAFAGNAPSVTR